MYTRARLSFDPHAVDSTKLWRSPLAGLPWEVVDLLGDDLAGNLARFHYENHFMSWEGPLAEGSAGPWTLSGVTGAATIAVSADAGGAIVLTADATGNCDPCLIYAPAATGHSPFRYVLGKRLWFFIKGQLSSVANMECFFGFGTPDTEPTPANTLPSDCIGFSKVNADTDLTLQVGKDGTQTSKASALGITLADATYFTAGFVADVDGNIIPYSGNTARLTKAVAHGDANMPIGAADVMAPMVAIRGASRTLKIDFLSFGIEL